eukprot:TRINITY_DN54052_c0_g1_i1.p1 TRINITY_DN54052_c0_g1~~TRINITY_DN54052_c0_g1_i1.p1  ORF type:complete len:455 (+),score=37.77 TRINITY_DN54052_c0_g1_i1:55-1419(+)
MVGHKPLEVDARSVLVVGLPFGVRGGPIRKPLREALKEFGVKRLRICTTHTGHCRGYAVVDLRSPEAAISAVTKRGGLNVTWYAKSARGGHSKPEAADDGNVSACADHKVERSALLQLSACCGGKVDTFFPLVPTHLRKQICLDAEAMHSTFDQPLAMRVAEAFVALCSVTGATASELRILDGCACCGGSAVALQHVFGGHVVAIEFDEVRSKLLQSNMNLLCPDDRTTVLCGDFCKLWPSLMPLDVIFLDVPWGGPQYGEQELISSLDLGGTSLLQLILQLSEAEAAPLLALRFPRNFDTESFAKELSKVWSRWTYRWDSKMQQPERPMPFRLELGDCGILFMICLCSRGESCAASRNPSVGFRLSDLDGLVFALQAWDGERGSRHHAAFFDWEASRWIPLSRWRGCKPGLRKSEVGKPVKHDSAPAPGQSMCVHELSQAMSCYRKRCLTICS